MHRTGIGLIIALLLTSAGCKSIGPLTIPRDRFDYNAAISDSWKSQMLLNMVKLRYGDAPVFLEVDSVNNAYDLGLDLTFGFSWSPGADTQGFGGTGRYNDHPSITYRPMTGDKFAQNLMTPLSPGIIRGLVQTGFPVDTAMRACVNSINGIQNRYRGLSYSHPGDLKFDRLCKNLRELQRTGGMSITLKRRKDEESEEKDIVEKIYMGFTKNADSGLKKEIQEDLELPPGESGRQFDIVSGMGFGKQDETPKPNETQKPNETPTPCPSVVILPRSFLEIAIDLASGIDVPEDHIKDKRVKRSENDSERPEDQLIHIKVALKKPRDAFVAARYRRYWFWIDDRDFRSKTMFSFLLFVFRLNEVDDGAKMPILTIPVG